MPGGDVRYARSRDGIDIAYLVIEGGGPDLLFVPGFVSHLDLQWDLPAFGVVGRRLSEASRFVTFDKRGTGLSDRSLGFGSLEDRMDDIRTVMDAVGIERAAIFGVSEGGPLAMLFAATYPDRVTKLATYGTFARLAWAPDYPCGVAPEMTETFPSMIEERWGTGGALPFFLHHAPATDDVRRTLARYERNACTRSMAGEILRRNVEIDIRSFLPSVNVPTLVLNNRADPLVSVEHARYLAEHLPDARLVEGDGDFHISWNPSEMWMIDEVCAFFAADEGEVVGAEATPAERLSERMLATVLFTDIVGSTERVAALGDSAWRTALDEHDDMARRQVERFGGRLVKTTGDGLLALLGGPSSGVECARSIEEAVRPLGLDVRAGVHTGEVERRGDDVGGLGVHIAARVAELAGAGEVWVSRTVRDLAVGSGLTFESRGAHELKGVPDPWELFSVA